MSSTEHEKCLYIIHKYPTENSNIFKIDGQPKSYGCSKVHVSDIVGKNNVMDVVEYFEVESDAKDTKEHLL